MAKSLGKRIVCCKQNECIWEYVSIQTSKKSTVNTERTSLSTSPSLHLNRAILGFCPNKICGEAMQSFIAD